MGTAAGRPVLDDSVPAETLLGTGGGPAGPGSPFDRLAAVLPVVGPDIGPTSGRSARASRPDGSVEHRPAPVAAWSVSGWRP